MDNVKEIEKRVEGSKWDEALKKASEKIQIQLNDKERIITQKVLNNNQKDSKISVEIFTSVEKQIASIVNYEAQEESLE